MRELKENAAMNKIIKKGWNTLVDSLGIADATRFIVTFERGEGDSVKEIKEFWKDKSIEQIHKEILDAKRKNLI